VSTSPRARWRTTSREPSSRSSLSIACETPGCETWQAWAALVIEPASAAATKYSSCRSVKEAPAMILTVVSVARRS